MNTLVCGSLAFDTIMVFEGKFKDHILPEKIHILNVSFLVPEMRREFGGTAGNIAYNMQLLDAKPLIMATVGDDFSSYTERLDALDLSTTHIKTIAGSYTAQAFITADLDGNQITAFHPGAMNESHANSVKDAKDVGLAIIAPDGREGMFQHARECKEAGIPFIFDPSQGLPMFTGDELMEFIEMADYLTINDYEAQLIEDKTGFSTASLAMKVKALVVTLGSKGSAIYADGQRIYIQCVEAKAVIDPTGCGDAYRAGLIYGITHGWDWLTSGRLASVMAAIKIGSRGGQNHKPSKAEIKALYKKTFGDSITLS